MNLRALRAFFASFAVKIRRKCFFKKVGGNIPEYYILDGDQTVAVVKDGAVKCWNILANGVAGRRDAAGNKFYYLKDHLGSTRAVVDGNGTVKEALDYYPFGLLMPGRIYQSGSEMKEKLTGKELGNETGWIHFPARPYLPSLRRWLTSDPINQTQLSLSPFHFTQNNPINRIDPDGKKDYQAAFYASLRAVRGGAVILSGHTLIIKGAVVTSSTAGFALPLGLLEVSAGISLNVWGGHEISASVADFNLAMSVPEGVDATELGNLALEIAKNLGVKTTDAAIIGLVADLVVTGPGALTSLKSLLKG